MKRKEEKEERKKGKRKKEIDAKHSGFIVQALRPNGNLGGNKK